LNVDDPIDQDKTHESTWWSVRSIGVLNRRRNLKAC
jgi:hypothetical protein